MWSINFSQTGSRIALLIGQVIVLVLCVSFIAHVYRVNILPDKEVKETFTETTCFVISKRLSSHGHLLHEYRADFLISYNVKGVQYNRWVSGNGLDMSFAQNKSAQSDLLSQFTVGGSYPCWFNPSNPPISLLVQRHNWLSTFPLMIPSVLGIIILYYLIKNLIILILPFTRFKKEE